MTKAELKWAVRCAAALMAVTMVPYVVMWWFTPLYAFYPWTLFNGDDHAVYYSWMRQAQEGHLLFRNLYTVEPQRGIYLHLYFLLVGNIGRIPLLGIEGADHLCRLFFGGLTLVLVYRLAAFFTADVFTRRVVFWTTAVSAGLGWLFWHNYITTQEPVDVWQSEAITFASLYSNGLFCVSLCLMLGVVICLLLAEERGYRWAVGAGVCGFLLANIHTYDLFHLAAAWGGYLLARWMVERRFPARALIHAMIAVLVTAPSFAYMAWYLKTEPIFAKRVQVGTLSGPLWTYMLGYGLLIPLAVWGAWLLASRETRGETPSPRHRVWLPVVWSVAGIAVPYLPVTFQRKMIMGEHLPLALLAGLAVAEVSRRAAKRYAKPQLAGATAAVLIGLLAPSMLRFMIRDPQVGLTTGFDSTQVHPVYWDEDEMAAFAWLRKNTPPNARLMTYPLNGILAPAYSGRAVFSGHWGETPDFDQTLRIAIPFYWGTMRSEDRLQTLRSYGINYVLDSRMDRAYLEAAVVGGAAKQGRVPPPRRTLAEEPFLVPVFHRGETTLYQVR